MAYVRALNVSELDPQVPPPHNRGVLGIVDVHRSPEDASFADVLDNPAIVTLGMIRTGDLDLWLNDSDTAAASHIANEILRLYHLSQARLRKALDN